MKKVLISIGTRPNTIKVTQFKKLLPEYPALDIKLLHTGQHYDHKMAKVFFEQFDLVPDFQISLEHHDPLGQSLEMTKKIGEVIESYNPDVLLTPGDVNSTFSAAYAAYKLGVTVGHIESGLRSFDRSMPEEINRRMTDQISDIHFTTESSGRENLVNECIDPDSIHFVGNTMIDSLVAFADQIDSSAVLDNNGISSGEYYLLTFHRPSNVDTRESQIKLVNLVKMLCKTRKCVFPIHPRTEKSLDKNGLLGDLRSQSNLILLPPLAYFEFQKLIKHARIVITDSGGIQEETTFQRIPCLTLRANTERPVTTEVGSNRLMEFDEKAVHLACQEIEDSNALIGEVPPLWDGKSTRRILDVLSR